MLNCALNSSHEVFIPLNIYIYKTLFSLCVSTQGSMVQVSRAQKGLGSIPVSVYSDLQKKNTTKVSGVF